MTTNITTLALNLLISERIDQRIFFAGKIAVILHENFIASEEDKLLKDDFMLTIEKCIDNPNGEFKNRFYQLAEYFSIKISGAAIVAPAA